jgi:hypothetical protein
MSSNLAKMKQLVKVKPQYKEALEQEEEGLFTAN